MQKQEKSRKPLIIGIIAAVVILAVLLALLLTQCVGGQGNGDSTPTTTVDANEVPTYELYWNVDRAEYDGKSEAGMSSRMPEDDGYFHVRFFYEGETITLKVADRKLINAIDIQDVMGLEFDENGIVVGVTSLDDMPLEKVGWQFYVQSAARTMLKLNSSESMNGMEVLLEDLDPNRIWDMSGKSGPVGTVTEAIGYDKVLAVQNLAGEVTHVFIYQRPNYMLTHKAYCEHCKEEVTWSEWVKTDSMPSVSGHYQLQTDVKLPGQNSLPEDCKLCLDLNGFRIDGKSGARAISMHNAGVTLAIMDTSEKETGVIASHGKTDQGGTVWVRYGALYLYSGTLDASDSYTEKNGACVECGNGKFFYMHGGTIIGGRSTYSYNEAKNTYGNGLGGALSIGGKFVMHDGEIRDGYAESAITYKNNTPVYNRGLGGNIFFSGSAEFEMNGGTIKNGRAGNAGGNIYADGACELTINGGTISGGIISGKGKNGGSVFIGSKATVTMNGGSIYGGVSYNCGGNIYLNGTLNMNGGYIGGGACYNFTTGKLNPNEASRNLFVVNGKFYMWGGSIEGGVSAIDSQKNGTQNAVVGLYGVARIDGSTVGRNLTISGSGDGVKVMVGNMYDGAKIGVNTTVGLFTEPTKEAYKKYFYSDIEGADVVYHAERLGLGRLRCICGNSKDATVSESHINGCDGEILMWAPWTSTNTLPTTSGTYYLMKDVTTTKQSVIFAGNDVELDLNGKNITLKVPASTYDGFRLYRADDGSKLAITDTTTTPGTLQTVMPGEDAKYPGKTVKKAAVKDEDGKVVEPAVYYTEEEMRALWAKGNFGMLLWVRGGEITVHNGILDGSNLTGAQDGMVVSVGNNTVTDAATGEKTRYIGKLDLYGGTIVGGYTTASGNINVATDAVMNVYGGTITDGRANAGGNISVFGTLNIHGGTITNGLVDRSEEEVDAGAGGNINIDASGTVNMYGGVVSNGTVRGGKKGGGHGGNIHVYGKLNAYGGVIRDGEATGAGGNVGTIGASSVITLDGVQVLDGVAGSGGNVAVLVRSNKGLYILGDTVISGGHARSTNNAGGGNVAVNLWLNGNDNDQILVIDGATIKDGTSAGSGANIYLRNATSNRIVVDDKTGKEKQDRFEVELNATMKSGTVSGGINGLKADGTRARFNGGSIYATSKTSFTLESGTISGGDTTDIGGNIYTNGVLNVKGGTVTGGVKEGALTGSSNVALVNGTLIMSGGVLDGNVVLTPTTATGCKVFLSGKPVINHVVAGMSLNEHSGHPTPVIEIDGVLEEGSSVAVNGVGYISTETPEENLQYFNSTSDAVLYHNNRLFLGRAYCICGASLVEGKEHLQFTDKNGKVVGCDGTLQAWAKWAKNDSLPTKAGACDGYYYLENDVSGVTGQQMIAADTHIRVDLNGKQVVRSNGGRVYSTYNAGSNLTITDSVGGGLLKGITATATTDQGVVWGRHGTVTLYAGTIDGREITLKNAWATGDDGKWNTSDDAGMRGGVALHAANFTMYGGEIIGGESEQYPVTGAYVSGSKDYEGEIWLDGPRGGAVAVDGTFNLYDGIIRDGQSANVGGNVYVGGTFNMYGGQILNGSINKDLTLRGDLAYGGNVYAQNMYMYGGLISGGAVNLPTMSATDATKSGGGGLAGNLFVNGRFEGLGGTIENGVSNSTGGNIGTNSSSAIITLDGTQVVNGQAGSGGNIAINVRINKGLTITEKTTVSGGKAINGSGGNILVNIFAGQGQLKTLPITISGVIENGSATKNGGNIYITNPAQTNKTDAGVVKQDTINLTLNGATISGGTVDNDNTSGECKGGNIYLVRVNADINDSTITGGTVTRNKGVAKEYADGGNIFASTGTVNITGSTISGGSVTSAPAKAEKKDGDKVIQAAEYFYARGGNIFLRAVEGKIDSTVISDGTSYGSGENGRGYAGNVHVTASTVEFCNGTKILGGTTAREKSGWSPSGNVYIEGTSTVTMTDTEVSGGKGASSCNNIYLNTANDTLTLGKGTVVRNTVAGCNNSICYRGGNLTIEDGALITNAEGVLCRNIIFIAEDDGVFNMTGGTISGGYMNGNGGNVLLNSHEDNGECVFTMSGGVIEGGEITADTANGGNVYVTGVSKMIMEGDAKVINGTSKNEGGNIYVSTELYVQENAEISGGTSKSGSSANIFVVNADVEVSGGKIDGGVGMTTTDAGVTNNDRSTLILSGKPVITKNNGGVGFNDKSDKIVVNGALEAGAEIWTRNVGTITAATVEANLDKFHHQLAPQEHDILFVKNDMIHAGGFAANEENTIYIGRYGCICGSTSTDASKHLGDCGGKLLKWQATESLSAAAGNWYLIKDVTRTTNGNITFATANTTWNLNLNGYDIDFAPADGSGYRMLRTEAVAGIHLGITNIKKSGTVPETGTIKLTITKGGQDGSFAWLRHASQVLDIYGGTIDVSTVVMAEGKNGTAIKISSGTVNQYGGTIIGGKGGANSNGGTIGITAGGVYNLYGGTVKGGSATANAAGSGGQGGNFAVYGTLNIYGGKVLDGSSKNNTNGNNIMVISASGTVAKLNIYGGTIAGGIGFNNANKDADGNIINPGQLTLSGKVIVDKSLTTVADRMPKYSLDYSSSCDAVDASGLTDGSYIGIKADGKFGVKGNETIKGYFHSEVADRDVVLHNGSELHMGLMYCLCGATKTGSNEHAYWCDGKVLSWIEWNKGDITVSGNYFVGADFDTANQIIFDTPDTTINLDLNGKMVTNKTPDAYSRVIGVRKGVHLSITDTVGTGSIAGSCTSNAGTIQVLTYTQESEVTRDTILNLYAGTFTRVAGTSGGAGGVIQIAGEEAHKAIVNMYSGKITDGQTASNGGNVHVQKYATFNLYGGEISNGTSVSTTVDAKGGNIAVDADGTFNMKRSELDKGSVATRLVSGGEVYSEVYHVAGGNIFTQGSVTIQDGSKVIDGTATAKPTGNDQKYAYGGNIRVDGAKASVTISGKDAEISDGEIISYTKKATTYSWAPGGNISVKQGTVTVSDGATVKGGSCNNGTGGHGSNFYVHNDGTVILDDAIVCNNASDDENIYVELGDLTVKGNTRIYNDGVTGYGIITNGSQSQTKDKEDEDGDGNKDEVIDETEYVANIDISGGSVEGGIYIDQADNLTLSGGTVDGGITLVADKTTYRKEKATLTVTGAPTVTATNGGITLANGKSLTVDGELTGGEIYVTNGGFVTGDTSAENMKYFKSVNGYDAYFLDANRNATTGTGKVFFGMAGCLCAAENGQHTLGCTEAMKALDNDVLYYQPYDATVPNNALANGGYWYLTDNKDVSVTNINIAGGEKLVLNLNGFTLTNKNVTSRFITTREAGESTVIFTDTSSNELGEQGAIVLKPSAANGNQGGLLWMVDYPEKAADKSAYLLGGTVDASEYYLTDNGGAAFNIGSDNSFHMYGGQILGQTGDQIVSNGGSVLVSSGTFNMYDGIISGGRAAHGGNVYIGASATFNMVGGLIEGGSVKDGGLGSNLDVDGTLNMSGGEIKGGVYVNSDKASFTKDAKVSKGSVYSLKIADGKVIDVAGLTGKLYVTAQESAVFAKNAVLAHQEDKIVESEIYKSGMQVPVNYQGGNLIMGMPDMVYCVCGVDSDDPEDHTDGCDGTTYQWVLWTSNNTLPTESGNYQLAYDIDLAETQKPVSGATIRLDLHGKDINLVDDQNLYEFTEDAGVTIVVTDTTKDADGQVILTGTSSQDGGIMDLLKGNTFQLYRATLNAGELALVPGTNANANGGVAVVRNGATLDVFSGKIIGAKGERTEYKTNEFRNSTAGAVHLYGTLNMHGGAITGGQSTGNGGNIYMNTGARLNMYGGEISNGVTGDGGANIAVQSGSTFHMEGGVVKGGKVVTIEDNKLTETLKTGSTTKYNIFVNGSYVEMSGGEIWGGMEVFAYARTCNIKLSGTAKIDGQLNPEGSKLSGLKLTNRTLDSGAVQTATVIIDGEMLPGASIGISSGDRLFTDSSEYAVDAAKYFYADSGVQNIYAITQELLDNCDNETFTAADIGKLYIGQIHCVCGGLVEHGAGNQLCDGKLHVWTATTTIGTGDNFILRAEGSNQSFFWYLNKDVTGLNKETSIIPNVKGTTAENIHFWLDTNGFDVTTAGSRLFVARTSDNAEMANCSINLVNTSDTVKSLVTVTGTRDQGALLWASGAATARLFNVSIDFQAKNSQATQKVDGETVLKYDADGNPVWNRHAGGVISVSGAGSHLYMEAVDISSKKGVDSRYGNEFVSVYVSGYAKNCTFSGANGSSTAVLVSGASLTLENCTVQGNVGGGVGLTSSKYSKLILKGETNITGNTATGGAARNVFVNGDAATHGTIVLDASFTGDFGLSGLEDVVVIPGVKTTDSNVSGHITADDSANKLADLDAGIILTNSENIIQCACGGKAAGVGDHQCEKLVFTPWTNETALPTTAGNYILMNENGKVGLNDTWYPEAGKVTNIDLNGHTVEAPAGAARLCSTLNKNGATISITDSATGGLLKASNATKADEGAIFWLANNANLNLYAGTLDGNGHVVSNTVDAEGKTVEKNGGLVTVPGGATFKMYGGTIQNGRVTKYYDPADSTKAASYSSRGGNVAIGGTMYMYGGTIKDGRSVDKGGNIFVWGKLYIIGSESVKPEISGGVNAWGALGFGGNIYIHGTNAEFTVENAKIINGGLKKGTVLDGVTIGENYGGNIAVSEKGAKVFEIREGTEISGGWGHRGGNIYIGDVTEANNCGTYKILGGVIKDGNTGYIGANICILSNSQALAITLDISGGEISLPVNSTAVNISIGAGAAASSTEGGDTTTTKYGTVNLTGGSISNGKVCLYRGTTLNVTAPGTVNNCTRAYGTYITNFTDANWGTANGVTIPNP